MAKLLLKFITTMLALIIIGGLIYLAPLGLIGLFNLLGAGIGYSFWSWAGALTSLVAVDTFIYGPIKELNKLKEGGGNSASVPNK